VEIDRDIRAEVRTFYDSVGWSQIGEGLYQNARYEDLRPVSREYIHRCHLRLGRFLPTRGRVLLDAGSGPIQYPEYLEYSRGFRYRLCLDLSHRALTEARRRIGDQGLFVVGDVSRLPFAAGAVDGVVSLHTIHHVPPEEQERAFRELHRVLKEGGQAAVVYSWGDHAPFGRWTRRPIAWAFRAMRVYQRHILRRRNETEVMEVTSEPGRSEPSGTYTYKHDYAWVRSVLADLPGLDVRVWRTASTQFLRAFVHRPLLGTLWLRLLFWLEERLPHFLGRVGQYPMILFQRAGNH
jgi:SAM-dependent methyltransferase